MIRISSFSPISAATERGIAGVKLPPHVFTSMLFSVKKWRLTGTTPTPEYDGESGETTWTDGPFSGEAMISKRKAGGGTEPVENELDGVRAALEEPAVMQFQWEPVEGDEEAVNLRISSNALGGRAIDPDDSNGIPFCNFAFYTFAGYFEINSTQPLPENGVGSFRHAKVEMTVKIFGKEYVTPMVARIDSVDPVPADMLPADLFLEAVEYWGYGAYDPGTGAPLT